ncbi:MAG UNVERIFIED_CONTAM: DNA mismatch repair endonuclease MutL [Rickettsiaceae bacterium]
MSIIRHLSETTINRIAAGEVVERPSSVVKELVENSLDAAATKIEIILEQAGKNLIEIIDNGSGIAKEDLLVAIQRHTTSKLKEDDIMNITSFGFRGEALPSIASVSRMEIISRTKNQDNAYRVYIEGGDASNVEVASLNHGTKITIRDLFFATPVRLKFLRSDKSELSASTDIIKRIAIAHPHCEFILSHNGRNLLNLPATDDTQQRIKDIVGDDFIRNSVNISSQREEIEIIGFASLPTYNKATSEDQFLFINNRPVKDKLLASALRVAYQDFLARDRFPIAVIFINTNPYFVDVNVHPAKTEVRFRDTNLMRGMLISSIKASLFQDGQKVSDTVGNKTLEAFAQGEPRDYHMAESPPSFKQQTYFPKAVNTYSRPTIPSFSDAILSAAPQIRDFSSQIEPLREDFPLGSAIAQVSDTYIISQTKDSIIITDAHAAHERLTYEKLKSSIEQNGVKTQRLLMPEIVELPDERRANLLQEKAEELAKSGLIFENFSNKSVLVTEVPQIIADTNIGQLINDMADNLLEIGEEVALSSITEHILETYSCHHSIRSGRKLSIVEMNHLLREMESTPFSGQCNHGRPTYITLKLKDIEKLFGR